ncbi:hypothetical protein MMC10_001689 [Thelotrema lepadinum]|nr:hypothetical protein [Thelotrema lepadinum]
MPSFMNLPYDIRRILWDKLLLGEKNETEYPVKSDYYWDRSKELDLTRPRPIFCTSLFTVSKEVSDETIKYFYHENGFIAVDNFMSECLDCCIPLITLRDDSPAAARRQIPSECLALTISMQGAEKIESQHRQYVYRRERIVFAARYLPTFTALLPYVHMWNLLYQPVEDIGFTFTFNLKGGRYDFSRPLITATILGALHGLKDFPKSANILGKISHKINGDLSSELADKLMLSFRSPMPMSQVLKDVEFLLREANDWRDYQHQQLRIYGENTSDILYWRIEHLLARVPLQGFYSVGPSEDLWRKLGLLVVDVQKQIGINKSMQHEFGYATLAFHKAINLCKGLQHSKPSNKQIAELHVLLGQVKVDRSEKEPRDFLKADHLREALDAFMEARHYDWSNPTILQKIKWCIKMLTEKPWLYNEESVTLATR